MRIYALFFWSAVAVSLWWCGEAYVHGAIGNTYHLMSTLGDSMYTLRTGAIVIPIAVALMMLALWLWRRPLAPPTYVLGLIPLGIAVALTYLPRVESGYEQTYWLENQRHSIPWVYGPYNGNPERGGDYFLIRVWGAELTPYYQATQHAKNHLILQKTVDFNHGKGGPPPENNCVADESHFRCEWRRGDYVYAMSIKAGSAPTEPSLFFQPVEELLNSFETDAN